MNTSPTEQIQTAVIFDRDSTLTKDLFPVTYYEGVVEAVLKIREDHICAIATDGGREVPLPGLDECFEGRYYVRHLNTSGGSEKKVDGRFYRFEWYIDPETGFPRNRREVFERKEGPEETVKAIEANAAAQELLHEQIDECENNDGDILSGLRAALDLLRGSYGKLSRQREEWWEDETGRRFDKSWMYVNPYSIAGGDSGLSKDLGLVRRWMAGHNVDSLRTVMVGDYAEFQTMISHPETPLIIPFNRDNRVWPCMPELINLLLNSEGPTPDQAFDELHLDSSPTAGEWGGKTEEVWRRSGEIVVPMSGQVELAGHLWTVTRAKHVVKHNYTGEETEFITRSIVLAE